MSAEAALPSAAPPVGLRADWVLTMDPRPGDVLGQVDDAIVVVDGDTIVDVGPAAEVLARRPGLDVEHLDGHVVLPGLVNAHTHLAMAMFRGVADDRDLRDFLATVLPLEAAVLDPEVVRLATRAALVESLRAGVTTLLDMYFFADAALGAAGQVGARVLTGPVMLDAGGAEPMPWPQRMARAREWVSSHPPRRGWRPVLGPHSTYTVSAAHLEEVGDLARSSGALVHVHAAETLAEVAMVTDAHGVPPVELLDRLGLLGGRTVVAHGVHLGSHEVDLLAASGAAVAHCPASNLKLASGVAPVPELLGRGVAVALGTDGPASSNDLDLLGAARLAALVHKTAGPAGPDPTALPAAAALVMATRAGAVALGLGDELGVLRPGALADVVAVDLRHPHTQPVYDPASTLVYAAGRADVAHVWVAGRRVVRAGSVLGVDGDEAGADLRRLGELVRSSRRR